jgi:hypothetical protein
MSKKKSSKTMSAAAATEDDFGFGEHAEWVDGDVTNSPVKVPDPEPVIRIPRAMPSTPPKTSASHDVAQTVASMIHDKANLSGVLAVATLLNKYPPEVLASILLVHGAMQGITADALNKGLTKALDWNIDEQKNKKRNDLYLALLVQAGKLKPELATAAASHPQQQPMMQPMQPSVVAYADSTGSTQQFGGSAPTSFSSQMATMATQMPLYGQRNPVSTPYLTSYQAVSPLDQLRSFLNSV